jgi:hypothetical protein
LWQDKSQWWMLDAAGTTTLFYDGIEFTGAGILRSRPKLQDKHQIYLQKLIKEYCKKVNDMDTLPHPGGGDCWHCCMRTEDGKTMGDLSHSDHLEGHLREKYVMGSLILNALKHKGYPDPGFIFSLDMGADHKGNRFHVIGALKTYFKDKFGIPR